MLLLSLALLLASAVAQTGDIVLSGWPGSCFALLEPDGFGSKCFDRHEEVTITAEALADTQAYGLLLYSSGKPQRIHNMRIAADHLLSAGARVGVLSPMTIRMVWPAEGAHITAPSLHIHYNTFGGGATSHVVCAAVRIADKERVLDEKCERAESRVIPITGLKDGRYCVRVRVVFCDGGECDAMVSSTSLHYIAMLSSQDNSGASSGATSSDACITVSSTKSGNVSLSAGFPRVLNPAAAADALPRAHVLAISARTSERYDEASVMIKSLLYNRLPEPKNLLILHLVVDFAGVDYFSAIIAKHPEVFKRRKVVVVLHDFKTVCENPLDRFLEDLRFPMSAHASGAAGYCRLFLHDYFSVTDLGALDLGPGGGIITVETDQLVLADLTDLWTLVLSGPWLAGSGPVFAAAENYQPWKDSRPFSTTEKVERLRERARERRQGGFFNLTSFISAQDHGNGIIGGIMALNFRRMGEIDWSTYLVRELRRYISKHEGWRPQLNDQDIFNALADSDGSIMHILPCEWNVQMHARINSIIYCASELFLQSTNGEVPSDLMEFFSNTSLSIGDIPLNCDESARRGVFVCERRARVLHFMAGSHSVDNAFMQYYAGFWRAYADLGWNLLL